MKVPYLKFIEDVSRVKSHYRSDYSPKVCGLKVMVGTAINKFKKSGKTMPIRPSE